MKKITATLVVLFVLATTTVCFAKQPKPELWEEIYTEKGVTYCIDINSIVVNVPHNSYEFLLRTFNKKKGYEIYSCSWTPGLTSLTWCLRWQGSPVTNKRFALPVDPDQFHCNTEGNKLLGKKLPLNLWQQAVTKAVEDEVMIYPENAVFAYDGDKLPLLPNYPYHNGRRR